MTATALLSAVLADPFDDGVRLVYADCLEENGEPERAEFIRAQIAKNLQCDNCMGDSAVGQFCPYNGGKLCPCCDDLQEESGLPASLFGEGKVIFRRGFPDEIRCTMAQWVGGPSTCMDDAGFHFIQQNPSSCPDCKGTGTVSRPGIAKAVCEAWPLTRVVISDKYGIGSGPFGWFCHSMTGWPIESDDIPKEIDAILGRYQNQNVNKPIAINLRWLLFQNVYNPKAVTNSGAAFTLSRCLTWRTNETAAGSRTRIPDKRSRPAKRRPTVAVRATQSPQQRRRRFPVRIPKPGRSGRRLRTNLAG